LPIGGCRLNAKQKPKQKRREENLPAFFYLPVETAFMPAQLFNFLRLLFLYRRVRRGKPCD